MRKEKVRSWINKPYNITAQFLYKQKNQIDHNNEISNIFIFSSTVKTNTIYQ